MTDEEINPGDLSIEVFHVEGQPVIENGRGARLTHAPTGTVTMSGDGTLSTLQNKAIALRRMRLALGMPGAHV